MTAIKPDMHETEAEPNSSSRGSGAAGRTPDGATTRPDRPQLSATQVVASVLAAMTATVAASYLGVAGTVIGAAVASVLTVVANAVYGHSIQRTGERVRAAVPASARWLPPAGVASSATTATSGAKGAEWRDTTHHSADNAPLSGRARLRRLGLACLAVFAVINVAVTSVELIAGRPISDLLTGKQASGTSLFGTHDTGGASTGPSPTTTVTVTPSVVLTTPTVTQTAPPVTSTVTPTVTSTPSPSPSAGSTPATTTPPVTP
jgi:hypothetical protein